MSSWERRPAKSVDADGGAFRRESYFVMRCGIAFARGVMMCCCDCHSCSELELGSLR
jgi:hypothetical protein